MSMKGFINSKTQSPFGQQKPQPIYIKSMDNQPDIGQETQPQPDSPLESPNVSQTQGDAQQQEVQPQENQPEQSTQDPQPHPEEVPAKKLLNAEELLVLFKKYDTDNDEKITVQQAYNLLEEVGFSIYEGTVSWTARMIHPKEYKNDQFYEYFTFEEFRQFYVRQENKLKREIWEDNMKLKDEILDLRKKIFLDESSDEENVAPKIKEPQKFVNHPFEGDIELVVGDQNGTFNSLIEARVTKLAKSDKAPALKLVLHQSSYQKAKEFEEKLKYLYKFLVQLGISKEPDYAGIIEEISFVTHIEGNKLIIELATKNQELLDLIKTVTSFVDEILQKKVEAEAQAKIQFNVDIKKFLEKGSKYTFYEALFAGYRLKLQWNAFNFKQATRQLYTNVTMNFDKKSDDPLYPVLVLLMNSRKCQTKLYFDNIHISGDYEQDTKDYILKNLIKFQHLLQKYEAGRLFEEAMRSFGNKFDIIAEAGDWHFEGKAEILNLNLLLSAQVIKKLENDQ